MSSPALWTKHFFAIMIANGLFFVGFHSLLPTMPLYVASLGASGTEIGIIAGIFSISSICIRFFTDDIVARLGKKRCLYAGILLSLAATCSYPFTTSVPLLIIGRIIQGLGFGLGTTFAAALAIDIIPAARRGEGVGYFGLGNTISMGLAPAIGVMLLTGGGSNALFILASVAPALALICTYYSGPSHAIAQPPSPAPVQTSLWNRFVEKGTGFPSFFTMLFGFVYGSVNSFIAMFAQAVHIENSGLFFVVGTVLVFLSRTFGGRIYDAKGYFFVILPGLIAYTIGMILILQAQTLTALLVAAIFYGLGGGLIMPSLMTWLFSSVAPARRSNASATFYNMMDIGTSIGIIALGALSSLLGYVHIFYIVLATTIVFLGLFVWHRLHQASMAKKF